MQLGGFRATSGRRSEWHLRWLGGMYAPLPLSDGPFSPAGAPTTGNPGDPRRTSYATSIPRLLSPPFYHENNGLAHSHEAVLRSLMHTRLSGSSQNALLPEKVVRKSSSQVKAIQLPLQADVGMARCEAARDGGHPLWSKPELVFASSRGS
jgi:hypothetical protein